MDFILGLPITPRGHDAPPAGPPLLGGWGTAQPPAGAAAVATTRLYPPRGDLRDRFDATCEMQGGRRCVGWGAVVAGQGRRANRRPACLPPQTDYKL